MSHPRAGGGIHCSDLGQVFERQNPLHGGLMPSEMKRLRQLEKENGKVKKIVADLSLDKEMLQDAIRRKL